ncbi:MAG: nitronate monooxygenase [Flavobacteriales bacterium]|nr:nitronate monooxygenase [Flavobacteriales bacterium]MCB9448875.1 nitronate monooxygenase [Flavobacteriales bacterium]
MNEATNRLVKLFGITYPVVQAGMIWCSGWELASAVSAAGGLGLIGAGSMYPDVLGTHIRKCRAFTHRPFGVNIPLLYPQISDLIEVVIKEKVPIVFTSAGNPATWTSKLKDSGITVVHVVANLKFARKAVEAGVDAIVGEGFEAGGHNGREETTTLCLIPMLKEVVDIPLIAAGGIGGGRAMLAAMALGADGVQIGSRFVASAESSAHLNFKQKVVDAGDGDTRLTLKELAPVRLLRNKFFEDIEAAYQRGAGKDDLKQLLGQRRSKKGMFEGELDEGELEIGQVSALIHDIRPAADILHGLIREFDEARKEIKLDPKYQFS